MGSIIVTTWTEVAAAISARLLWVKRRAFRKSHTNTLACLLDIAEYSDPSVLAHSRLGPRTMAMLLGVILLMSLSCASLARNLIRYLQNRANSRIRRMQFKNNF